MLRTRHALLATLLTLAFSTAGSAQPQQCPPPSTPVCSHPPCPPLTCAATCQVTCLAQLLEALDCLDQDDGCAHIVIPQSACVDVCDDDLPIEINASHNNLHLEINGTLRYVGPDPSLQRFMLKVTGASNITIDSTGSPPGRFTSIYTPCVEDDPDLDGCNCLVPDASAKCDIATAIRLENCTNVTIRNLNFTKLTNMVLCEAATSSRVVLEDLRAGTPTGDNGMTGYGVFLLADFDPLNPLSNEITNCEVYGAYFQHCFRMYASKVIVTDCEGYDRRASGIWAIEGDDITVNNFITDSYMRFGPNFACCGGGGAESGQRLRNVKISNVSAGSELEVELGTMGCYLNGITAGTHVEIGDIPPDPDENFVPRPINRIHWQGVSAPNGVTKNQSSCMGADVSQCPGDVDDEGLVEVDVDDLIAVILAWGSCPPAWPDNPLGTTCIVDEGQCIMDTQPCVTPQNTCPADVAPIAQGNGAVDVDDLITVILNWGCPGIGPPPEGIPQDLQDCMEMCNSCCPETYGGCMQRCFAALCAQGQTQYCDD